jgi:RNA polymerase sigma factor (sigma-70 family)
MEKDSNKLHKIIEQCKKGDRRAQKQLFDLYSSHMLAVCQRYTKTNVEAEDLLIEGYMKMYDNLDKYEDKGMFEAWLKKIMVNNCLDYYYKNRKIETKPINENIVDDETVEITKEIKFSEEEILDSIRNLSNNLRLTFNLSVMEGYSHSEIAIKMGMSIGVVKTNIYRAKKELRNKLLSMHEKKGEKETI